MVKKGFGILKVTGSKVTITDNLNSEGVAYTGRQLAFEDHLVSACICIDVLNTSLVLASGT